MAGAKAKEADEIILQLWNEIEATNSKLPEEIKKNIEIKIHNEIGLRVNISLVEPKSLPRSEGKAVRVIDKRNL